MEILTTGVNSGLGRYIYEKMRGVGFTRDTSFEALALQKTKNRKIEIIVHCAFNSQRMINSNSLYNYLEDNVILTKNLVCLPHKKFIYISSVDIYPKDENIHSEEEIMDLDCVKGIYGITKLMSESIVKKYCKNYLILRTSALLGKYSRKNILIKIIEDEGCVLSLSGSSIFNYVLHSDVLDFIKLSIQKDLQGIFNLTSSGNITLSEITQMLDKKVRFGNYFYNVGNIDNRKVTSLFPVFKKTSKEVIIQYMKEK